MQNLNLNEMEISAIGEVANISIGNAATSMSLLVQNEVQISTPELLIKNNGDDIEVAGSKEVVVTVDFVKGIMGRNLLFMQKNDAKMIADLMMGSDGHGMFFEMDFSEMHLSAVSEAMNQAMGSAATAIGLMMDRVVDISTPECKDISQGAKVSYDTNKDTRFVQISFEISVGELFKMEVVQAYPYILAKAIADIFLIKKGTMDK